CGSRVISYVAVDSSAAAAIDVQIDPGHIASARGVRDRSERGPPHSDLGPIQKGPGTARLPGDETGLPREAGRNPDAAFGGQSQCAGAPQAAAMPDFAAPGFVPRI